MERLYTYIKPLSILTVALLFTPYIILLIDTVYQSYNAKELVVDFFIPLRFFYFTGLGLILLNFISFRTQYRLKEVFISSIASVVLMMNLAIIPLISGLNNAPTRSPIWAFVSVIILLVFYISFTLFSALLSIYISKNVLRK